MNACAAPGPLAWRSHIGFGVAALACVLAFGWIVTFGTFKFVAEDSFGSFYDHQAAAWLNGRWDVPEAALQGESFIVNGKVFGYFGPTPALFRLPLVALGVGFASTTRIWMLLHFIACLGAAYALYLLALRWSEPRARANAWAAVIFTVVVGMGSTLFFLSSRAYVYHEAILSGAAFALWSVFCALRFLQAPASRWWIGAVACGVLAQGFALLACLECSERKLVSPLASGGRGFFASGKLLDMETCMETERANRSRTEMTDEEWEEQQRAFA